VPSQGAVVGVSRGVDDVGLQQVRFGPHQSRHGDCRQVAIPPVLPQHGAVVPQRCQRLVRALQTGLRGGPIGRPGNGSAWTRRLVSAAAAATVGR